MQARHGLALRPSTTDMGDFRVLPCRPIWRGFLLDTGVYAAAWLGVLLLIRWRPLRCAARARRGQCAACGYDRAGLAAGAACPECGAGLG
ncbi:MAG: hypothetical protein WD749_15085 [Phycisphaerales bacterium]